MRMAHTKGERQALVQFIQESTKAKGATVFARSFKQSIQYDTPKDARFFLSNVRNT